MNSDLPPALLYHKVDARWEVGVTCVSPRSFHRQMGKLAHAGWTTILPDEIHSASNEAGCCQVPSSDSKMAGRRFLLIFDDGYEGIYHEALPILRELGFKAVVFIPTGFIGRENDWDHHLLGRRFRHLSRSMLADLSEVGWAICSHTVSHPDLNRISDERLTLELTESRRTLQEITGQEVNWVSFPFGRYNRRVIAAAVEAGYSGAVVPVIRSGVVTQDGFDLLLADAVYLWDTPDMVLGRLHRGRGYRFGRAFRCVTNSFSLGTVLWKRIFSPGYRSKQLATGK